MCSGWAGRPPTRPPGAAISRSSASAAGLSSRPQLCAVFSASTHPRRNLTHVARNANAAPRKAANGTWWFNVDIGIGPDGRRRRAHRRGFPTKKAAQEELDRLRHSVTTATYVASKRQTLAEYLTEDWLPAQRHDLARSTWESYERNVRNHMIPALGGVQVQQLDGGILNRFYAEFLESGRKLGQQSPGLKPRTVRYIHTILHAALDDADGRGRKGRCPHLRGVTAAWNHFGTSDCTSCHLYHHPQAADLVVSLENGARGGGLELSPCPSLPIPADHELAAQNRFPATSRPLSRTSVPVDPGASVTSL
jgi:hypothetical protein